MRPDEPQFARVLPMRRRPRPEKSLAGLLAAWSVLLELDTRELADRIVPVADDMLRDSPAAVARMCEDLRDAVRRVYGWEDR